MRSAIGVRASAAPMLAAAFSLVLSGCQTAGPGSSLAMDASDPCQGERAAFAGSKTYFQDKIVAGAAMGAAVGAGAGALAGLAAGGTLRSTLIGAGVGGVAGGVVGAGTAYYNTLSERAHDQDELAANMSADLTRESQEIDHTAATFARLRACRYGQARLVKNQARHHEIDKPTALAQIAYHRDKFDEEIRIARELGLTMARRGQQFQEASNELKTRPPVAAQGAPPSRTTATKVAQVNRAASVSVPEKRASYDGAVASAEKTSKAAFDLDNNASLSWVLLNGFDA